MTTRAAQDALLLTLLPSDVAGAISAADIRAVFDSLENNGTWVVTGSGAPATAAEAVGDFYVDESTTPNTIYIATGTSDASDYKVVVLASGTQTLTNKTLTTPIIGTIRDSNGNEALVLPAVSSAVNYPQISGAATGNAVELAAAGDDTNIGVAITPKGTGNITLGNFVLNADATIGAGQDDYVLTYDHASGTWGPEAVAGGGGFTQEQIEDFAGAMVGGASVQTRITVTYDDTNGELDFVVDDDLANYDNTNSAFITAASTKTLTNTTFDANGTGNSISNIDIADISAGSKSGADATLITGTAGTAGNLVSWDVNGDAVDSTVAVSALLTSVGTADIDDNAVTLAKFQQIATDSFIGRDTAGTGNIEVLSAATVRTILNVENGADVTDATNVEAAGAVMDADIGVTVQAYDADTLKADVADTLTVGFDATSFNAGTKSSGIYTPAPASGNYQYIINGGAFTLAPQATTSTVVIHMTNNGTAGAVTTSGFDIVTGDALTTTDTHKFIMTSTVLNGDSWLNIVALQ